MRICQTYYDTTDCYSLSRPKGKSFTGTVCARCLLLLSAGKRAGTEQLQSPGADHIQRKKQSLDNLTEEFFIG